MPAREEINQEYCWKLEDIFDTDEVWRKEYQELQKGLELLRGFQGTAVRGPERLFTVLETLGNIEQRFERVYVYANQKYHQDTGNQKYQEMSGKAAALSVALSDAAAFLEPEILTLEATRLEEWLEEYEPLRFYRRYLGEIMRRKPHVLSRELEGVLAKAKELGNSPQQIFMAFNNADIDFGTIQNEAGEETALTNGRYTSFMESENREVRRAAFQRLYQVYGKHKNMLAATFEANLKQARFFSSMRQYPSPLEEALDGGNIPAAVYTELIRAVHEKLPAMYRYVRLRKRLLGTEELHMYDVYTPLVKGAEKKYSFEDAKTLVKEGLAVLGEDYGKILEEGFQNRWIDVYENRGKRSGAYSWGAYGTHPYVLLNFSGNLNSVFTLAHEMGHAIHSYYSDHAQPYIYAGYRIFVAEVASTVNEFLLISDLIRKADSRREKAYLVNYLLEQFRGTLYRQTMFAEFEKMAHERLAEEGSLSAGTLCSMYGELNRQYFGPDMVQDPEIDLEWARIPHFYTPFYVYQYATGFSAAIAIGRKILKGEKDSVEHYKEFLRGGCSMDPIDLLKLCGVDMTEKKTVEEALEVFESCVRELEELTDVL
ncbi:MAG TPA: oligoendopeptidase F [Candidatus Scatomonas merdigallinarum]|nr:oligoendopeptidase F [Candidatus Scatomonas merdigallinarum]